MKKYLLLLLLCCLIGVKNVKADTGGREVIFVYNDNSFSSGVKTYTNGRTVITISYKNSLKDLTPSQLAELLNQKSNTNAGKLYGYGSVKVKINPTAGGKYDSVSGKSVYLGTSDPVWQDSNSVSIDKTTEAAIKALESTYYTPVMKVYYRKTTSEDWQTNTNFTLAESRTLESKLAELLNIDLEANPKGVVNAYNDLYYFEPLTETDVATTRFDIYDKGSSEPTLVNDKTDVYNTSSLNHLGSEYLILKHVAPTKTTAVINEVTEKKSNVLLKTGLVIVLLGALGGISWYLKKNNIISFE